jgi:hypothetical protein
MISPFLLDAKANWGHTGIVGGFIVQVIKRD